jgi:serine-type D-Ala-D-Ala carboxypeptidase (penicillin-binding protein 5/6)
MIVAMQTHRNAHRKPRLYFGIFAASIFVVSFIYISAVLLWPLQPITPNTVTKTSIIQPEIATEWPTNFSAIGDTEHGFLAASDDTQVPIASISKLVTALVILDAKPLKQGESGPAVTITSNDIALYNKYIAMNGTVGAVASDMQLSEYQLLQGMLLGSANNYADTAAIWAFGSVDAYVLAANAYLQKQGFRQTAVADATGFSTSSKSTAQELIKLGILAINQPIIAGIVSQKSATIPGVGTFINTNKLLGSHGIIGLKTGTTEAAGSCLLFASQFTKYDKPITLVGVVLGAPNHPALFQSVSTLTQKTTDQYITREITNDSTAYATYRAPWGASAHAISSESNDVVWQGAKIKITSAPRPVTPEGKTDAGELTSLVGTKSSRSGLELDRPLAGPGWAWRISHPKYIFGL